MTTVTNTSCRECGADIWMSEKRMAELRLTGVTFHCLAGHAQCYRLGKSEAEKRAEIVERDLKFTQQALNRAQLERDRAIETLKRERNKCSHCGKQYLTPERLKRHQRDVHGMKPKALPADGGPNAKGAS